MAVSGKSNSKFRVSIKLDWMCCYYDQLQHASDDGEWWRRRLVELCDQMTSVVDLLNARKGLSDFLEKIQYARNT